MSNKTFLDILFENRNKEYGAYQLRQIADHDLMRAFFVGIGIVTLITSGALYANYRTTNIDLTKEDDGVIVILDPIKPPKIEAKKDEVIPPKEVQPMEKKVIQLNTDQVKHVIPTPTESPKIEETIKSVISQDYINYEYIIIINISLPLLIM